MKKLQTLLMLLLIATASFAQDAWQTTYKQIESSIKAPQITGKDYVITKFGAGTNKTAAQNQAAINKAIAKASKAKGGRVVVPAGTYNTAAITMQSNVNLYLEEGAVLHFAFEPELYPQVLTRWEGLDCWNISPCIYAYKAENIAITGKGTINGGGAKDTWWPWCGAAHYGWKEGMISQRNDSRPRLLKAAEDGVDMNERRFGPKDGLRPQLINFNQCENILLENVTLLDSPFWVIHPLLCKNITVRGLQIINDGPNGDGCDPESCDGVLIENCKFKTGDDCIAIKSGRNNDGRLWDKPSQNIIIRNCDFQDGHGGVVIGSEISGGCRNVFAENNTMDSPNLDRVVRIKTNTCRGGLIENIYVRNIKVGQCRESVLKINLDYEHNEICCRGFEPTVRNVYLENVTCEKSQYGVQIIGLDNNINVYNINVKDCKWNGVRQGNSIKGKTKDIHLDNLYINGGLVLQQFPYKHYSEWMTYSEMKRTPQSYMLDFSTRPKWSYVMGIELEGMLDTYLKYGGEEIKKYCQEYTDTMINEKGEIRGYKIEDYNLDQCRTGHFVSRMYELFPEKKNLIAMQTLMQQLKDQPRTEEGVYWHKAIYAYQVWLDGIFMGLPFRTLTAGIFQKPNPTPLNPPSRGTSSKAKKASPKGRLEGSPLMTKAEADAIYNDVIDQIKKTYERTLDPKTGLNRHAWDETHLMFWADKETGLSQHCWGRAQGWYSMALIEILDALPTDHPRRGEVIELLKKDLDAVIKWQDKQSGVWYQVMDSPGREGNYLESTCSAMFAYCLLKAYAKGYLGAKYRDAGIKAYRGIINNFIRVNDDKTISLTQCCAVAGLGPGTSPKIAQYVKKPNERRDGSYAYYLSEPIRDNDAKGLGPFIWASLLMEDMGFTTENVLQPIDRQTVVTRNNPKVTEANELSSLSVGNGHFATTVDVTGLQSFPQDYENGVPLCAMSDWGWHSFPNTDNLAHSETLREMDFGKGHSEIYAVEYKNGGRNQAATSYFRVNPHRLNLGSVGLSLKDSNGKQLELKDIKAINQELLLWDGTIESRFSAAGTPVEVTTGCEPNADALFARVKTPLLANGQAAITIRFPYPTGKHCDAASNWNSKEKHSSKLIAQGSNYAVIERELDETKYYATVTWEGEGTFKETAAHEFELALPQPSPNGREMANDLIAFRVEYTVKSPLPLGEGRGGAFEYDQAIKRIQKFWHAWWNKGGFVDFGQCTDPRAKELERRVILSQYLTQINCANSMPPQETGLTYNSWFGRPHLEMTWWHATDFALWNRPDVVAQMLKWYNETAYTEARNIAKRQGYNGVRWMKMTDPWAGEAPSNTGSFLTWQQPHYIYLAEEMYRANPTETTLKTYGKQVEETAQFMGEFVVYNPKTKAYEMRGQTAMQESMSKDFSYNHPFDIAYWRYGLEVANKWRERQGLERNKEWDEIIGNLAELPTASVEAFDNSRLSSKSTSSTTANKTIIYTAGSLDEANLGKLKPWHPFEHDGNNQNYEESVNDSPLNLPEGRLSNGKHSKGKVPLKGDLEGSEDAARRAMFYQKCKSDHPAVLGACGLIPESMRVYNKGTMQRTLDWVMQNWEWGTTWGWDYGMTAMAAARLDRPETALEALLLDKGKNRYLVSGHNYQTADRLRLYLPGNGALLDAVAMMCAGWDGCPTVNNPGFPKDGKWNVRWEGLNRMQ